MITFKQLLEAQRSLNEDEEFKLIRNTPSQGMTMIEGGGLTRSAIVKMSYNRSFGNNFDISALSGSTSVIVAATDFLAQKMGGWNSVKYVSLMGGTKGESVGNALVKAHGGEFKKQGASKGRVLYTYYTKS